MSFLTRLVDGLCYFLAGLTVYTIGRQFQHNGWAAAHAARRNGTLTVHLFRQIPMASLLPWTCLSTVGIGIIFYAALPVAPMDVLITCMLLFILGGLAIGYSLMLTALMAASLAVPPLRRAVLLRFGDVLDKRQANGLTA